MKLSTFVNSLFQSFKEKHISYYNLRFKVENARLRDLHFEMYLMEADIISYVAT